MDFEKSLSAGLSPTGVCGLDEVLLGGFPRGNSILLEGPPGSGKTTLGLQLIYESVAKYGQRALVVSFDLSPERVLRDAAGFGWTLSPLIESGKLAFVHTSPSVLLEEIQSHNGILAEKIKSSRASRILVDGLTPLKILGERLQDYSFRQCFQLLLEHLAGCNVEAIFTREGSEEPDPHQTEPERFLVDSIVRLGVTRRFRSLHRSLEVLKSRGQCFLEGEHSLRIESGKGVVVYPRVQAIQRVEDDNQPTSSERLSIGSSGIDALMGGGPLKGSVTLIVGISGTGKTVTGMQFLTENAKQGKRGLLVSLDEHPAQIVRNAVGLGFPLDRLIKAGAVAIDYHSPLELELDVHFKKITDRITQMKAECVVIDSLAVYESSAPDEARDFIYALTTYLKDRKITAMLNYESPELLGISQISEGLKASPLVDNIILLNYVEISTHLRRALAVPKVRGSKISQLTREFIIAEGGIALLDENSGKAGAVEEVPQLPFSAYYGLLSRSPVRRSPVIDGAVGKGESLPESVPMKPDKSKNS